MVDAMCYVLRTGVPWRDLPRMFGAWQSVYTRWRRWCRAGLWARLFKRIAGRGFGRIPCIKVHAHGANPAGGQQAQAMGRTKGGLNTKLAMIVDALGRPVALQLAPGNRHDLKACAGLWHELRGGWLVADRAFDSDQLRAALAAHGLRTCIPTKARRRKTISSALDSMSTATRLKTPTLASNAFAASAPATRNSPKPSSASFFSPRLSIGFIQRFEDTP